MSQKSLGAVIAAAVLIVAVASPSIARERLTREDAMLKCNAIVKVHRAGGMASDMQRTHAWKACMTHLGFHP